MSYPLNDDPNASKLTTKVVGDTRIELATSRPPGVRATTALIPEPLYYTILYLEIML